MTGEQTLGKALRSWLLVSLLFSGAPCAAIAEIVEVPLHENLMGTAWFQAGDQGPALLLLHGFLQTRDYLTVRTLASSLSESGYTVLVPTLSLGIDRRRRSLACEAVHSHTLANDLEEIDIWVAWLKAKGYQDVRLVGHSHGSLQLLAYASSAAPVVRQLVATSLIGVDQRHDTEAFLRQRAMAQKRLQQGETGLQAYQFSYCQRYMATPAGFLSYAAWDNAQVLAGLKASPFPVEVILGDADARMETHWPAQLRAQGVAVTTIQGAGHFFDSQHEFDLLDAVVDAIGALSGAPSE